MKKLFFIILLTLFTNIKPLLDENQFFIFAERVIQENFPDFASALQIQLLEPVFRTVFIICTSVDNRCTDQEIKDVLLKLMFFIKEVRKLHEFKKVSDFILFRAVAKAFFQLNLIKLILIQNFNENDFIFMKKVLIESLKQPKKDNFDEIKLINSINKEYNIEDNIKQSLIVLILKLEDEIKKIQNLKDYEIRIYHKDFIKNYLEENKNKLIYLINLKVFIRKNLASIQSLLFDRINEIESLLDQLFDINNIPVFKQIIKNNEEISKELNKIKTDLLKASNLPNSDMNKAKKVFTERLNSILNKVILLQQQN